MTTSPKVPLCRLYEKTSKTGTRYFVGRFGQARVLMFKDREQPEGGDDETWSLMVEAVEPAAGTAAPRQATARQASPRRSPMPAAKPTGEPIRDDDLSDLIAAG